MQQLTVWWAKAEPCVTHWRSQACQIWLQLDLAQRCYLVSVLLACGWMLSLGSQQWLLGVLGVSLFGAVLTDIWQGFLRVWHSLPGKAFILISYAVLANFCFALADSSLNSLIGVRPDVVPFSANLTLMLMAPFWSFLLAFALLSVYMMLHMLNMMLLLMLRPLGVRSRHLLKGSYPKSSMLARLVFLPVVFIYLAAAMTGYLSGNAVSAEMFQPSGTSVQSASASSDVSRPQDVEINVFGTGSSGISGINPEVPWINKTVAWFLYHVESLSKSQCLLQGAEHLVHLNLYEVLVITPDPKQPYGYRYQVRSCGSPSLPDFTRTEGAGAQ